MGCIRIASISDIEPEDDSVNLRSLADNSWCRFFLYLILVVVLRWDSLGAPLIGDSASYIMPTVFRLQRDGLELWPEARYLGEAGYGHPFLVFHLLVLVHKLGIPSPMASHGLILLFSALALFACDRLGSALVGSAGGLAAGLLFLATPIFIAQAGLVRLAMPLTAFMVLTLYGAVSNRWWAVALFGSLAVLSKEPGVWFIPPVALLALVSGDWRTRFRRVIAAGIPGIVFVLWMLGSKLTMGLWINRPGVRWEYIGPMYRFSELFSGDGRFYISIVLFLIVVWRAWMVRWHLRLLLFPLLIGLFWTLFPLLQGTIRYNPKDLPFVLLGLTAFFLGIGTLWKKREVMLWGIIFVHLIILSGLRETMPRYLIPALAVFVVLFIRAVWEVPRPTFRYIMIIPALILFVIQWHRGLESFGNLNYRIELQGHLELSDYMQTNLQSKRILYDGAGHIFRDPRYGFVTVPLDVYGGKSRPEQPGQDLPDRVLTTVSPPGFQHRISVEKKYIRQLEQRLGVTLRLEKEVRNPRFRGRIYRVVKRGSIKPKAKRGKPENRSR